MCYVACRFHGLHAFQVPVGGCHCEQEEAQCYEGSGKDYRARELRLQGSNYRVRLMSFCGL